MTRLYLDFETRSSVPIRRGTDVYLANAKPLLLTYAIDDGPVKVTDFTNGGKFHAEFFDALQNHFTEIWAHNAFFDRMVLDRLCDRPTYLPRWRCSMALALAHSLPGGLGPLCEVLGVPTEQAKIADGRRLLLKFCCKKEFVKDEEWPLFIQYAINDVIAMRECVKRMPNWNYQGEELRLWHVDQDINNRGFRVDTKLAEQAVTALKKEKDRLDNATWIATCGSVEAATQRDRLLTYLCEQQGCVLRDLRAPTIAEALEDESLEEATKALLRLRLEAAKTSTSKYKRMLESTGSGGRLRGTLQYSGAARTARWAGRIFQPQNLPRPTMPLDDIRLCTELIRNGQADMVSLIAPIGQACSSALRGLIVADEGETLMVADYSAIEGRVNAWLAGESWKIKAFRDGEDLYKLIYARAFSADPKQVSKADRQKGKVMELALGYGGGVGAFINLASGYGMDLEELGRTVTPLEKSREAWEKAIEENMTYGLTAEVYQACDTLKIGYRRANPEIAKSWYLYEEAARSVIADHNPGKKLHVGLLTFDCNGSWLRIKLPSGRFLCYAVPRLHADSSISYMAWRNKRWSRTRTYGGKLCENIVQAIARDLLASALLRMHDAAVPVVLHIHDEIIASVPEGSITLKQFIALMATCPEWANGLPLNAEGFEGIRYEKH